MWYYIRYIYINRIYILAPSACLTICVYGLVWFGCMTIRPLAASALLSFTRCICIYLYIHIHIHIHIHIDI